MAEESNLRKAVYARYGCNSYDIGKPNSTPIAFWVEHDIWDYISRYELSYSRIYDMGYERTGCMFCMFGVHMEKSPNRFEKMRETHPKHYKYCMEKLGLDKVLSYMKVDH